MHAQWFGGPRDGETVSVGFNQQYYTTDVVIIDSEGNNEIIQKTYPIKNGKIIFSERI